MNQGTKFLKYGRHVKSQGKLSTYREHLKTKGEGYDGSPKNKALAKAMTKQKKGPKMDRTGTEHV